MKTHKHARKNTRTRGLFLLFGLLGHMGLAQAGSDLWTSPARLTHVGPDLDRNYDAREASVAHNSTDNELLVVWEGTDNVTGVAVDEAEIYGQRINPQTNAPIESRFRISFMGPAGDARYDARNPDVAYNAITNEYLVVWYGDHNQNGLVEGEFEIFGQRINAANGELIGSAFRISDMGPTGNRSYDAIDPVVAWNSQDNNFLVVWRGEDGSAGTPVGEFEIYAQLLNGSNPAQQLGVNDRRISDMGPDGSANFDAYSPEVVYNATDNEFLVVWYGDDNVGGRASGEFEIYAQRVSGSTGAEIGANDFSVSETGPNGNNLYLAQYPDVAWNADRNEYLVVWSANKTVATATSSEYEIYAQRLAADGSQIGRDDFRVSYMGPEGSSSFDAFRPHVAYHRAGKQYVVAWRGDNAVDGEFEIWSQRLDGRSAVHLGQVAARLSHAGPDGNLLFDARRVNLVENSTDGTVFAVWEQEDNSATQAEGEFEIFATSLSANGYVLNNGITGSWYDPAHDGEGWMIERLAGDQVLAVWYTYRPDAPVQAWMVATGHTVNNRVVLDSVQITSGGVFGPAFDPAAVQRTDWGGYAIEFDDCNSAQASYTSVRPGFGAGYLGGVRRITNVDGLNCQNPAASGDPMSGITGPWYDPSHDGEGWVLEYLGNNSLLMAWFSYDTQGNQRWFLGVGTSSGDNVFNFSEVQTTSGTVFGPSFNPANVQRQPWGTVTITVNSCTSLTVDYQGPAAFGSGQLQAVPIVGVAGLDCSL